ncbi:hypothetical protein GPECTOR_52g15 [Gonium pectorale]|uniref:Uncharacterized protein n=1 Tax=Gonium pectorale TaxID=33097 RepID=A0A150G6Y7_GONPE|nr:hypothetical protein GPECTOR_52g15 [Gonium pectorale]|eukprot:KXZ45612.1 hypothetical protein GPECTOR_52g15 [Gonium pectorale]
MRSHSTGPRRLWTVLGLCLIALTHHQAAAQVTATKPQGGATRTTAGGNGVATNEAAMWQQMSDSLARVLTDTFGNRPAVNATNMVQTASDWLRNLGVPVAGGQQAMGNGAMADAFRSAVTNSQLADAFEELRATARSLGMGLPANSPALDTWSRLGEALRGGAGSGPDFTAVLPVLMNSSLAQSAAGMAQASDPVTAFLNLPGNIRTALATLSNLGLDAFLNGPGALISLTSLGIGLAAGICGILGGAFYIAGSSVLLGAGVDSLDPEKIKEYKDNKYIQEFNQLAAESQATILPAALNRRNVQLVDLASEVLSVTIGFVDRANGGLGANLQGNLGNLAGNLNLGSLGNLAGQVGGGLAGNINLPGVNLG